MRRKGHRFGHHQPRLRRRLPGQPTLFGGMNSHMTTRGLTSTANVARDVELRAPVFRMTIRASDLLPLMDCSGFLIRMAGLATRVRYAREAGVTRFTAERRVGCRQWSGAVRRIPFRGERDRGPS